MTNGAPDQFSTLDDKINVKGFFERVLQERERTEREYRERIDERFASRDKELKLQAAEYERRLSQLNHEHQRVANVQSESVTQERFEQYTKTEAEKRETALERVNEKFDEYVKRYEQRQREVDLLLQAQTNATAQSERAAEKAAVVARDAAAEQGRKNNRNIGVASVLLAAVVVVMNLIGAV